MPKHAISVIGSGYVGLTTAVGLASKGYKVTVSTHDKQKAASINKGTPPFYEPGLTELLQKVVKEGNLKCVSDSKTAVLNTEATFIASGTPNRPDGSIDLQFIKTACREIGQALKKKNTYHLIIVKSTVVPGTTNNVVKPAIEKHSHKKCGTDFGLCMSPEFLAEGSALHDTLEPDRIVIGEHDNRSGELLETLYKDFCGKKAPPIVRTNLPNAELVKYASNAFLAMKVSFINQIANLCQKIPDADVAVIAKGIGLDKRIGPLFLKAGLGWGGSCFPKDLKALVNYAKKMRTPLPLTEATLAINSVQPLKAVQLAEQLLGNLERKNIAILGLSFKPGTDDMRDAVSIRIIQELLKKKARVRAYDPAAAKNTKAIFEEKIRYSKSAMECIRNADCTILVTEWPEFLQLKPEDFALNMKRPILVDGRHVYDAKRFSRKLRFASIGVGTKGEQHG